MWHSYSRHEQRGGRGWGRGNVGTEGVGECEGARDGGNVKGYGVW